MIMKNLFSFIYFFFSAANIFAQKEIYDITTYTAPAAWKKAKTENAIQLTKEDAATGTYCAITLFKSLPATASSKENFDLAWTSVVKQMVTVSAAPEMQNPETENGWETQSGYAPFEKDSNKGVVILVTSTGFDKMVNIIILTNTDEYEKDMTAFLGSVSLKKPIAEKNTGITKKKLVEPQKNNLPPATTNGFAFTTTNFDDGWNSTVQEDWVEVTKANIKVLIHYPNKNADAYNSVLLDGLKKAWDVLIAPKYSSATNMEFKSAGSWESIEFAEAEMVEKATGKTVYVVFFKKKFSSGAGKYIEFISPNKKTFEQEFGTYENASANFGTGTGFDKMAAMANYNKFAVAASDLSGKWTSNFTGMTQYVNAYTGASAGADTHASNENFEFGAGNTYKWDLGVASGFVGNIKFQSVKSTGRFTSVNNWQVKFSDIEGKPRTYNVQFVCIKGARVLWIGETGFGKKE